MPDLLIYPHKHPAPPSEEKTKKPGCLFFWRKDAAGKDYRYKYSCLGLTIVFQDPMFYVPEEIYRPYLYYVIDRFSKYGDAHEAIKGVTVTFTPSLQRGNNGLTSPESGFSLCRSSMIFDVDEYELSLHLCHRLWGPAPEGTDISRMQAAEIPFRQYPGVAEAIAAR